MIIHAAVLPLSCRICYSDPIVVQEDQYPPNIAVKVNQSYCHVPVGWFTLIFADVSGKQVNILLLFTGKLLDLNITTGQVWLQPGLGSLKWGENHDHS